MTPVRLPALAILVACRSLWLATHVPHPFLLLGCRRQYRDSGQRRTMYGELVGRIVSREPMDIATRKDEYIADAYTVRNGV